MKEHFPRNNRFTVLKKIVPKSALPKSIPSKKALSCIVALWSCCALAVPQEFTDLEIREIATGTAGEGIYLATGNHEASADGCGPGFFIEAGHPLLNQNLAIALSGLYAKSRVQIRVDGCADNGSMKIKGIGVAR